jgi:hypothetical protein
LNLRRINQNLRKARIQKTQPLFSNDYLDNSIIVKHTVRPHEYEYFENARSVATKILVPLDQTDLRSGAWSLFVGERKFEEALWHQTNIDLREGSQDRAIIDVIDGLPSLDPFLLREKLREAGIVAQTEYFVISSADIERMFRYARESLTPLAHLSTGSVADAQGRRLAEKILKSDNAEDLASLRESFSLSHSEFAEGIFAWRGFLYYSWRLKEMGDALSYLSINVYNIGPSDISSREGARIIEKSRSNLQKLLSRNIDTANDLVRYYSQSFNDLIQFKDVNAFRKFLLEAPHMFSQLGNCLGALDHFESFWRFRFPKGKPMRVSSEELQQLFVDFEETLGGSQVS